MITCAQKTQYRGNNGLGYEYHIALIGMVHKQGCPTHTRRYESTALCDLFVILLPSVSERVYKFLLR